MIHYYIGANKNAIVRYTPELFRVTSQTPTSNSIRVFSGGVGTTNHRPPFYSIGESVDLAKLDGRVSDLINAYGRVIP
jgi:hypothetical protein